MQFQLPSVSHAEPAAKEPLPPVAGVPVGAGASVLLGAAVAVLEGAVGRMEVAMVVGCEATGGTLAEAEPPLLGAAPEEADEVTETVT